MRFIIFLFLITFSFGKNYSISYVNGYVDEIQESLRPDLTAPVPIKWGYIRR